MAINWVIVGWFIFIPFLGIMLNLFRKYIWGSLTNIEVYLWMISIIGTAIGAGLCL